VNGKHVVVPQAIGIGTTASGGTFFAQIHTHDASGILHVESDKIATYTLGQFFKEWQVKLTSDCIGSNCGAGKLKAYVNGKLYSGDPNGIVLTPHEEIAIVFGGGKAPSHYSFPQGL
jgi:hypothetical protein